MLNRVILTGRLTAAPELKQTQGGITLANFNIAVERNYASENGKRETDFFSVVAWRGTAEFIARNFGKGQMITIVGSLENHKWEDQDGNKRATTNIRADEAHFGGDFKKPEAAAPAAPEPAATNHQTQGTQMQIPMQHNPYAEPAPTMQDEDDLPF